MRTKSTFCCTANNVQKVSPRVGLDYFKIHIQYRLAKAINSRISLTRMVINALARLSECTPLSSILLFGAVLFLASLLWFGSAFTLIWATHLLVCRLKQNGTPAPVPIAAPFPSQTENPASVSNPLSSASPKHQHPCCLPKTLVNERRPSIRSDDGSGSENEDSFGFLEERRAFRYYNQHDDWIAKGRRDAGHAGYRVSVSVDPR